MLSFGIKEVMVASKTKNRKFGIKEVLVVKILDFADWPFPESAAAKLKHSKYDFAGWAL